MHEFVDNRAVLRHTALCFAVAGALGFLGGGLAGMTHFTDLPIIARYAMVLLCMSTCFAIFWCTPDGPERWRPFVISREAAEGVFGGAAGVIVFGGLAAVVVSQL